MVGNGGKVSAPTTWRALIINKFVGSHIRITNNNFVVSGSNCKGKDSGLYAKWNRIPAPSGFQPTPRCDHRVVTIEDQMYIYGGRSNCIKDSLYVYNTSEMYFIIAFKFLYR